MSYYSHDMSNAKNRTSIYDNCHHKLIWAYKVKRLLIYSNTYGEGTSTEKLNGNYERVFFTGRFSVIYCSQTVMLCAIREFLNILFFSALCEQTKTT
jgi:hypothetical protein